MVHRFVANRPGAAPAIWIPGAFGTNQHRDTWEGGDQKNQPLGVDFRLATCDDLQRATRGDFQLALDNARATCMPDTAWAGRRLPSGCSRGIEQTSVLMSLMGFRHVISGSLAFAFVAHT